MNTIVSQGHAASMFMVQNMINIYQNTLRDAPEDSNFHSSSGLQTQQ